MRFAKLVCSLFLVLGTLTLPAQSRAQVAIGVSVRIGPPLLPVYEQPLCPGEGYIWIPGYWAYSDDNGYYWVPGTWALPPEEDLLWTPGYWAWQDGGYVWYAGYWGPVVGFYGGIDYGFGYPGVGFYGGYWRDHRYFYNRNVSNVDVTIVHNTYNTTVIRNTTVNHVSFNGGSGGVTARPTQIELAAARQHHVTMTGEQVQHERTARSDRNLFANVNHGRPDVAATPRPSEFKNRGAAPTLRNDNANRPPENRGNNRVDMNRPENRPENRENRPPENVRPNDNRPPNANRVDPRVMDKHQREQDNLRRQQDSERQRMEQRQAQEQQKMERRNTDTQHRQGLEQRQQQQQQQMQQRHEQQTQKLEQRQQRENDRQQQSKPTKQDHPPHNQQ